jgi:hypothetical protein
MDRTGCDRSDRRRHLAVLKTTSSPRSGQVAIWPVPLREAVSLLVGEKAGISCTARKLRIAITITTIATSFVRREANGTRTLRMAEDVSSAGVRGTPLERPDERALFATRQ